MLTLNKNIKLILNYVVGPLVFCVLAYSIYAQLQRQANWKESLAEITNAFDSSSYIVFLSVIGLMILNWGIEARKWQVAINVLYPISFYRSFKAIFTGTTMAFFTPNRIGEYMGRMLYLKKGQRIQSVSVTIVCSMAQLMITLGAGIAGLFVMSEVAQSGSSSEGISFWMQLMGYITLASLAILTILYFKLSLLVRFFESIPKLGKYVSYVKVLNSFNATILLRILSLSGGRYLVFIFQYYLLFRLFGVEMSWWQTVWCMSTTFLLLAIVPSVAIITDLGIRWKASLEMVRFFSNNSLGILATSMTVWFINLVIPALIGSLLILGLRMFKMEPVRKINL